MKSKTEQKANKEPRLIVRLDTGLVVQQRQVLKELADLANLTVSGYVLSLIGKDAQRRGYKNAVWLFKPLKSGNPYFGNGKTAKQAVVIARTKRRAAKQPVRRKAKR